MLESMAIGKGGTLPLLWHDLRCLTTDPDLIAVCLFAGLGLTAALHPSVLRRSPDQGGVR